MPTFFAAGSRGTNSWTDRERVLKNFSAIFNAVKVTGQSVKGKGKVRKDSSATLHCHRPAFVPKLPSVLPLPNGEGWGEGRDRSQAWFASTPLGGHSAEASG